MAVDKKAQRRIKELKREVKTLRKQQNRIITAMTGAGAVLNIGNWDDHRDSRT